MEITSTELINKAERKILDLVKGAFNSGEGLDAYRTEQCKTYVEIINFIESEEMEIGN